jgi:ATP-dependent DNA ligase
VIENGSVRAYTRNGHDWTHRYLRIVQAAADLGCSSAIIDGEAIVQDEQGRSDFHSFKEAMSRRPEALVFMAFDLLHINGQDMRGMPLIKRREALQQLVGCHDPHCRIQYSEHVVGDGSALFQAADQMGLEGVVSKRLRSRYRSGRSRDWLKVKCWAEAEFIVIGVEHGGEWPPTALLARERGGVLTYAGSAAVTLASADRERFWRSIDVLRTEKPPLPVKLKQGLWVRPLLRVRARYLKGSDKLRHATMKGLMTPAENVPAN